MLLNRHIGVRYTQPRQVPLLRYRQVSKLEFRKANHCLDLVLPRLPSLAAETRLLLWMEGKGEAEEQSTGPLSVLAMSVKTNTQLGVISNNRNLLGCRRMLGFRN